MIACKKDTCRAARRNAWKASRKLGYKWSDFKITAPPKKVKNGR
jgi:hypothetical protein